MSKLVDLTGQRYGRLTVIKRAGTYTPADGFGKAATWLCRCDCGSEVVVLSRNLRSGNTQSCGCYCSERTKQRWAKYRTEKAEQDKIIQRLEEERRTT